MDHLLANSVSFRTTLVKRRRKPYQVAVLYMGETKIDPDIDHVVPCGDLRPHWLTENCWCMPEQAEPGLWVHNAMDGRERHESESVQGRVRLH